MTAATYLDIREESTDERLGLFRREISRQASLSLLSVSCCGVVCGSGLLYRRLSIKLHLVKSHGALLRALSNHLDVLRLFSSVVQSYQCRCA